MEPDPQNSAPHRVEAYLDQILMPLMHRLSPFHQKELRRELRAHLQERIEAYIKLGMSNEEASDEALRQFGGAEDFLKQWQREWIKTTPQATLREIWAATWCALLLSLPALFLTCFGSTNWSQLPHTTYWSYIAWAPDWMRSCGLTEVTTSWTSFWLDFIVLPIALGIAAGRLISRNAGIGMLGALAIEIVLGYQCIMPVVPRLGWFADRVLVQVFFCSIFWLPIACTTAALIGWWTRRWTQSRQLA